MALRPEKSEQFRLQDFLPAAQESGNTMAAFTTSGLPLLKPILCTYNPHPEFRFLYPKIGAFSFLRKNGPLNYQNSIEIKPSWLGTPWPTSFPVARQCRHWEAGLEAGKELLLELRRFSSDDDRKLPSGLFVSEDPDKLSVKGLRAVENATNAGIYMNPGASKNRMRLLVKSLLAFWLHDDVVETHPEQAGYTAIDEGTAQWSEIIRDSSIRPSATSLHAAELIEEDPDLGRELMQCMLYWFDAMRQTPRTSFTGLRDFLDYRTVDIAAPAILAFVRFANETRLSTAENDDLRPFLALAVDHVILVNDFYSYEKEKRDFETGRCTFIVNTVHYLGESLSVEPSTAKSVALQLLAELEGQLGKELTRLRDSDSLNETQLKYACAVLEMVAGNLFYSMSAPRYGEVRK
ncbi:isoprenoid synthase domain-containing protein [Aspergillus coremiiformis]|uniref:Isoprenoid synthase domain-containing protein n=1 Tax=Aspergillus coremiiformis TaxID=138285 RepID=A0A5N6Z4G1_9EURO|nr:isoprenoid synthase domain-containing protein [Aspergillus coremiiformis]